MVGGSKQFCEPLLSCNSEGGRWCGIEYRAWCCLRWLYCEHCRLHQNMLPVLSTCVREILSAGERYVNTHVCGRGTIVRLYASWLYRRHYVQAHTSSSWPLVVL